jgi:hypothetical protein
MHGGTFQIVLNVCNFVGPSVQCVVGLFVQNIVGPSFRGVGGLFVQNFVGPSVHYLCDLLFCDNYCSYVPTQPFCHGYVTLMVVTLVLWFLLQVAYIFMGQGTMVYNSCWTIFSWILLTDEHRKPACGHIPTLSNQWLSNHPFVYRDQEQIWCS